MASSADKASGSEDSILERRDRIKIGVRKPFFHSKAFETFVDWITDEGNYDGTKHRFVHTYNDIAGHINSKHGTKWDQAKVKYMLVFVERRYHQAKKILTSTGQGGNAESDTTLRDKVLAVCPPFEKLHTVFGTPVAGLQLPPVQTLSPQPEEPANSTVLPLPDMVDLDDSDDMDPDHQPTENETTSHSPRSSRRQKMKKTVIATSSKGAVVNKRASREEVVTNKPFDAEGIDTLVDWITDAGNYESSTNRRSIFGQKKLVHSHRDIASYINSIHGTEWSQQTVANRLIWLKKVYDRAKKISTSASKGRNTETDTTLREKVLTVCPPFKRLHTVFEIPVAGLQLPPVQTLSLQPEEPANSKTLLSPRDMADQDGIDDKDYDDHFTEDETASHSRQRSKRREMEKTAITTTSKSAVNKRASKENDAIKRSFNADGIGTLVDWITDAEHYMPTVDHQSIFRRRRLIHSHCDIASYINSIHGTKWDWHTVSNRLLWLKGAYYRARKILTSAGEGEDIETDTTLRDKVLTICPPFERLDAVFGEPLESLHLPPVQTLPPQPEEPVNSRALLLPHDMVDHDDIDDKYYDDHLTEDEAESHSSRAIKRQKTEKTAVVTPQDHIGQIIQASDRPHIPMDDAIGDIRRRQDVLEAGQKDITDRLLETERKHHEMLTKREEQHMDMLMQMEEQHRERLKKRERRHRKSLKRREKEHKAHHHRQWKRQLRELEDEKAELREEKAELKEVKEELKQKKAQFKKERDGMLQNMAAMMRELDLKTTCSHRH